jgi:hypothetical protein
MARWLNGQWYALRAMNHGQPRNSEINGLADQAWPAKQFEQSKTLNHVRSDSSYDARRVPMPTGISTEEMNLVVFIQITATVGQSCALMGNTSLVTIQNSCKVQDSQSPVAIKKKGRRWGTS